jgi:transposase
MLHRVRNLLVCQRTMLVNALRAHVAEFGIIAPLGLRNAEMLTKWLLMNKSGSRACAIHPAADRGPTA